MCVSKKAERFTYEYSPNAKKPCGVSYWIIFYLITFAIGCLILVFLRYAINEIKIMINWPIKNYHDQFVTSYLIHLAILLSSYCSFLLLLVFLPIRVYGVCAFMNTSWLLLTLVFTTCRELSDHLSKSHVANEKMKSSLALHTYAMPIIFGYSALLTAFLVLMRLFWKRGYNSVTDVSELEETKDWLTVKEPTIYCEWPVRNP
ncbi:hypothetical protein L3Y34_010068 [Caenorhabditis briggsae]|nr:hypothetical protein L3Y34_010068 [Caenorhabditis briggsae]